MALLVVALGVTSIFLGLGCAGSDDGWTLPSPRKSGTFSEDELREALAGLPFAVRFKSVPHEGSLVVGVARQKGRRVPFAVSSGPFEAARKLVPGKGRGRRGGVNYGGIEIWWSQRDEGKRRGGNMLFALDSAVCAYYYDMDRCPAP